MTSERRKKCVYVRYNCVFCGKGYDDSVKICVCGGEKFDKNYLRKWIIENAVTVIGEYYEGITLRQLHYRLVAKGMTNDVKHYKKVVAAMTSARWDNTVSMDSFVDRERSMYGVTEAEEKDVNKEIKRAEEAIKTWMRAYNLDRWSNQDNFVEVWIEKKALQGVFETPCMMADVALAPCKGYPSLTFLNDAKKRFLRAQEDGKHIVILYFGDYDPSGEDIPVSIGKNLENMGVHDIDIERIALNPELIQELQLPGVPPKVTDSRTAAWEGDRAVELDAVEPRLLREMCEKSISQYFDGERYDELQEKEDEERQVYQDAIKEFVSEMG